MSKSNGVFLAIATLIMSVVIWGNPVTHLIAAFAPPAPIAQTETTRAIETTINLSELDLSADEQQLMGYVTALDQPRFTPEQKDTARQYISSQLISYGLTPQTQPYESADGKTSGVNIIAELPGSDLAAGSIVLGAHYDTVKGSSGADDNGSAIATLLEAARLFSGQVFSLETPPPRTLKLVFFDQEEHQEEVDTGLLGSIAFTKSARYMAGVKGAVILDMVGYACRTPGCQNYPSRLPLPDVPDTGDFLAVLGLKTHTELLSAFMRSGETTWPLLLSLPIPEPSLRIFPDLLRSDHAPFWTNGIPAVFVTDTANFRNPNYHTTRDTRDTLDPSFFRGSAQHVINAIATLLVNQD